MLARGLLLETVKEGNSAKKGPARKVSDYPDETKWEDNIGLWCAFSGGGSRLLLENGNEQTREEDYRSDRVGGNDANEVGPR